MENRTFALKTLAILTLSLILIFLSTDNLSAETASVDEMDLACRNMLSKVVSDQGGWAGQTNPKINRVDNLSANDTVLARVYNIAPEGFIIVPVLKDLPPVKAYSEEGFFDINDTVGFPRMVREVLQNRIRNFVSLYGSMETVQAEVTDEVLGAEHRRAWNLFTLREELFLDKLNKDFKSPADTTMGPLLTTSWHQSAPYNNNCPMGCWSNRTVVGCVATAMAQLMAYYQWPPEGYGYRYHNWSGDYCCDPPVHSNPLYAYYNDPYDWANIPDNCDGWCSEEQQAALAELSYEVGVACSMDYSVCGSGANPDTLTLANYFRYKNNIKIRNRINYSGSAEQWFYIIMDEIDAGRPILYYIDLHAIVCDGYQIMGFLLYYHMNYGWGGYQNTWFVIDELYCDWPCFYLNEYMFINITPDKRAMFAVDTVFGWAPLTVNFEGDSELDSVTAWNWVFGDGKNATGRTTAHTYTTSGLFDVSLRTTDQHYNSYTCPKQDYIIVLADTLIGGEIEGPLDSTLEVTISAVNCLPLYRLDIPVEFGGPLDVSYLGYTLEDCRTEDFENVAYLNYNASQNCLTLALEKGDAQPLQAGEGPVIKLLFKINEALTWRTNPVITDGYASYLPRFYAEQAQYQPAAAEGRIIYNGCCLGFVGNVDCSPDENPDITDISRIIDFLYLSHNPLCCPEETDIDGSGGYPETDPDITDISRLIDYLYLSHDPLPDCP